MQASIRCAIASLFVARHAALASFAQSFCCSKKLDCPLRFLICKREKSKTFQLVCQGNELISLIPSKLEMNKDPSEILVILFYAMV